MCWFVSSFVSSSSFRVSRLTHIIPVPGNIFLLLALRNSSPISLSVQFEKLNLRTETFESFLLSGMCKSIRSDSIKTVIPTLQLPTAAQHKKKVFYVLYVCLFGFSLTFHVFIFWSFS